MSITVTRLSANAPSLALPAVSVNLLERSIKSIVILQELAFYWRLYEPFAAAVPLDLMERSI
jgi:hypothetical protein